jgi:hypothetical protein
MTCRENDNQQIPFLSKGRIMPENHTLPTIGAQLARGRAACIFTKSGMEREIQAHFAAAAAAAPALTLQGSTPHFKVYYQTGFANGPVIANGVLNTCENDYNYLLGIFGLTPPVLPINVIIEPGIAGAAHESCTAVNLYCDGDISPTPNLNYTRMLVVAEEDEVFMANCRTSPGEGLSRVLARERYPTQADAFASAPFWLNTPGRPDFVTNADPTDANPVSVGCSVLFLNYLRYQLGFTWQQIINATGARLEDTYRNLTGRSGGFRPFRNLMRKAFPEGQPANIATDNPFPLPFASGICEDPNTLPVMDQWLANANPVQNQQPGWAVKFEAWGRIVGTTPTTTISYNGPPQTPMPRCEWLRFYSKELRSTNLGTLFEYLNQ